MAMFDSGDEASSNASNYQVQTLHVRRSNNDKQREIEKQETEYDSPDRLGITLGWHRDGGNVAFALRKAIAEQYRYQRRKREFVPLDVGVAGVEPSTRYGETAFGLTAGA
jgi:hypothetical protein